MSIGPYRHLAVLYEPADVGGERLGEQLAASLGPALHLFELARLTFHRIYDQHFFVLSVANTQDD